MKNVKFAGFIVCSVIRKILKIAGWTILSLTTLVMAAAIMAQSPGVQTRFARWLVPQLEDRIDADISIEKINFRPFNALVINNITVTDKNPFKDGQSAPVDTFFSAKVISATFSLTGLLKGEGVRVRRATVTDGVFAFVNEGGSSNLQRILRLKKKEKTENDKETDYFSIASVSLSGMRFRLVNASNPREGSPGTINWSDLDVQDIKLSGRRLSFRGKVMKGILDELSFTEKSGFAVSSMSGSAEVGGGKTQVKNLHFDDGSTNLDIPQLLFSYEGNPSAWSAFTEEVGIEAGISGLLSMRSLGYFAAGLQNNPLNLEINAKISGHVANLDIKNLEFKAKDIDMGGKFSGTVSGLPDAAAMQADVVIDKIGFTTAGLSDFINAWSKSGNLDLRKFAAGEPLAFSGKARGKLDRLAAEGLLKAGDGSIETQLLIHNLLDKQKDISINGRIAANSLEAGAITGFPALGKASLETRLALKLGKGGMSLSADSLSISRLGLLGHEYSSITASGKIEDNIFSGFLSSRDSAIDADISAMISLGNTNDERIFQLESDIRNADLYAMNLDKRGPSSLSAKVHADFSGLEGGMVLGDADILALTLRDTSGTYDIGNISLSSGVYDGRNRIRLVSRFGDMLYSGTAFITEFFQDILETTVRKELPVLTGNSARGFSGNCYDLTLRLKQTSDILPYFINGPYIAEGTTLKVKLDSLGNLDAGLESRRLAWDRNYLKGVSFSADNSGGGITATIDAEEIMAASMKSLNNRIIAYADEDHAALAFSYDNDTELANKGELYISSSLARDTGGRIGITADILPSAVWINDEVWNIENAMVSMSDGVITARGISFNSNGQEISLEGELSDDPEDAMNLDIDNFNLETLGNLVAGIGLQGILNGSAVLRSPKEDMSLQASVVSDSTWIAGQKAGHISLSGGLSPKQGTAYFSVDSRIGGKAPIGGAGRLGLKDGGLDARLTLDSLNLGYAAPLLSSLFSSMEGSLSGEIALSGTVGEPVIAGKDLHINDADVTLGFTNVPYRVSGPLRADNHGLWFDSLTIKDRRTGSGTVTGGITWESLDNPQLSTRIDFDRMEVLNLAAKDNSTFYGNINASGRAGITGPLNALALDIVAETAGDGSFHLPVEGGAAKQTDLLTFKEDADEEVDPYELMLSSMEAESKKKKGDLSVRLAVTVHDGVQAYVTIGSDGTNALSGRGNGTIEVEVRPSWSVFSLGGNYTLSQGSYNFQQLGLVRKDFEIKEGSNVRFNGGIMETDLDITATYKTKALIGPLISDSYSTTRRTVECIIDISGRLKDPEVELSVNVPDLDPYTQAEVDLALSTKDEQQKQFLALLISGTFLPEEQSGGVVSNSSMISSTLPGMMAKKLNDVLQKMNVPVDLGINMAQTGSGIGIFDVNVSTELFGNKVLVNGSLGNRNYGGGYEEMFGDLDIEIKIDKSGNLRLTLFSHSADQYANYLDDSQRNGVGITYQKEFDRLREFIRSLFSRRTRRRAEETAREIALREEKRHKLIINE